MRRHKRRPVPPYPDLVLSFVGPAEIWGVMDHGVRFRLGETYPDGVEVTAVGTAPMSGHLRHCEIRKPDGTSMGTMAVEGIDWVQNGAEVRITMRMEGAVWYGPEKVEMDEIEELRRRLREEQERDG